MIVDASRGTKESQSLESASNSTAQWHHSHSNRSKLPLRLDRSLAQSRLSSSRRATSTATATPSHSGPRRSQSLRSVPRAASSKPARFCTATSLLPNRACRLLCLARGFSLTRAAQASMRSGAVIPIMCVPSENVLFPYINGFWIYRRSSGAKEPAAEISPARTCNGGIVESL